MPIGADALTQGSLRRLNRSPIESASEVRSILERAARARTPLLSGIDGQINLRTAQVESVLEDRVILSVEHLNVDRMPQLYFGFDLGGSRYFFAADVLSRLSDERIEVAIPPAIHEAERRSLPRVGFRRFETEVSIATDGKLITGHLLDRSYEGAGVALDGESEVVVGSRVELSIGDRGEAREQTFGLVRNSETTGRWKRIGLSLSAVPYRDPIAVDHRARILTSGPGERAQQSLRYYGAAVGAATSRLTRALGVDAGTGEVEILRFPNNLEHEIVAIADRVGSGKGGVAVVIAPAWGRTKETMLPLAAVLSETFAMAGEPALIVRFDGTNRRGEAWVDPACRESGSEYLHFRFSQAVHDIHSTVSFLALDSRFLSEKIILVTASLASVEGRRAVATDPVGVIKGWVSLVGMVDLHSGLRAASGGVDYAFGIQRGAEFGRHEIAGVVADMDLTGRDVLDHGLGLFEDARRDMAAVKVPVSWIHGRHDGWIELERVRELMSAGDMTNRRLVEVPTGHQLRSSKQALETFQLVAEEVGRMAFGRRLTPVVPRGRYLAAKQAAERSRRPKGETDFRAFWRRYVLGRSGQLGIEILAATKAYRELMNEQIARLILSPGDRIADLGAGAGDFAVALGRDQRVTHARVTAVDFVPEALHRGNARLAVDGILCDAVVANLNDGSIPLGSGCFDAVLASLVVSYVARPERLIAEMRRILKPGGRLVVSCPRRDADLSRIYVEGIRELNPARVRQLFGEEAEREFSSLQRDMLNQGARLLSLEEEGWFRFWDRDELAQIVQRAGFEQIESSWAFGEPPQVALVSAVRT